MASSSAKFSDPADSPLFGLLYHFHCKIAGVTGSTGLQKAAGRSKSSAWVPNKLNRSRSHRAMVEN